MALSRAPGPDGLVSVPAAQRSAGQRGLVHKSISKAPEYGYLCISGWLT